MSLDEQLDRRLADWMEAEAAVPVRRERLERTLALTSRRRPRPGWLAVVGSNWHEPQPLGLAGIGRSAPHLRVAIAIALLVAGLIGAVIVIGSGMLRPAPVVDADPPVATATNRPPVLPTDVPRATVFSVPPLDYADAPGQLAYAVSGGVFLANADGSSPKRVAAETGDTFYGVQWSPDGRHLLITGSGDSLNGRFHVADSTGTVIFSHVGCCATWSPDGTRVAAMLFDFQPGPVGDREPGDAIFVVVGLDGASTSEIRLPTGRHGNLVQVFWSPDGRSVIVDDLNLSLGAGQTDTWAIGLDGGEPRPFPIKPVYAAGSFFSPDGSQVVGYVGEALVVAAADGSHGRALADDANWFASAWSPDSRRIAMVLGRGEEFPTLHIVDASTGESSFQVRLDETGSELTIGYVLEWSPNNGRILFSAAAGLWAVNPDGSDIELLVPGIDEAHWQPLLAP